MSYSIHYDSDNPNFRSQKKPLFGLIGAILVIMVCAAAIGWAIPQQAMQFRQVLLPWTRTEVKAAFAELREDLRQGEPLSDAVTAFCLEIIHDSVPTK